jgi:hypothetical protein
MSAGGNVDEWREVAVMVDGRTSVDDTVIADCSIRVDDCTSGNNNANTETS